MKSSFSILDLIQFSDRDIKSLVYFSQFTALKLSQFILGAALFVGENFQKRLTSGFEKVIKAFRQKFINREESFNSQQELPDDLEECRRTLLLKDEFKKLLNIQKHSKRRPLLLCESGKVIGEMVEFGAFKSKKKPVRVLFCDSHSITLFKFDKSDPDFFSKPLPSRGDLSRYECESLPKFITHLRDFAFMDFDHFRIYLAIIFELLLCDSRLEFPERIHREVLSLFDRDDLRKGEYPTIKKNDVPRFIEARGKYPKNKVFRLLPEEKEKLKSFWHEFFLSLRQ
jgi:hypothetical protein